MEAILDVLMPHWGLLLLLSPIIFFTALGIRNRYFHPLSSFPGPFLGSLGPLYSIWSMRTLQEHLVVERLHKKYGPIVRYQSDVLLFADSAMVPIIYNRFANKTEFNRLSLPGQSTSVASVIDHKEHSEARKKVAGMYSQSAARQMEGMVDKRIEELKRWLKERYVGAGKRLDFSRWSQYFAYDVISEVAFGKPFGFMASDSDVHSLISSAHEAVLVLNSLARSDWIKKAIRHPAVVKLMPAISKEKGIGRLLEERDQLLADRINDQSKGGNTGQRVDMMQHLLNTQDSATPLTIGEVKAELLIVMFAGSDTTASTLRSLVLNVLGTPGCYETLMSEIDNYTATHPPFSVIPYGDAVALPYLTACFKESMRLSPATPSYLPRAPPKGGLTLADGRHIPEGMKISVNTHVCQRDPKVYGEDADMFNPQRWLQGEAKVREMERHEINFGAGSRVCLGKHIASLELWKVAFEFFRTYKIALVEPEKIKFVNIGFLVHKNMVLEIEERA